MFQTFLRVSKYPLNVIFLLICNANIKSTMCKHNQLNELVQYVNAYVELIIASKASSSSVTNAPVSIYPYISYHSPSGLACARYKMVSTCNAQT